MDSDSEQESIEGEVNKQSNESAAEWGRTKHDYYYTDYVDQDYPSKLNAKDEKLAAIEQEEALRIQKKLLSSLEDVDLDVVFDDGSVNVEDDDQENLIDFIEKQNQSIELKSATTTKQKQNDKKRKRRVAFEDDQKGSDVDDSEDEEDGDESDEEDYSRRVQDDEEGRKRRPINMAIKKNRGLTPYKKKEYRNPRVKHKLKYKKAMTKRRRNVREAQIEYHRYTGEATGIKTSTVKSIKLC